MEVQTISKKQQKKTLSGKKTKRETIKNVLGKPFSHYWPIPSNEDNTQLTETLNRLLPKLQHEKINIPYKDIKTVPKEERKKFRQNYSHIAPLEVDEMDRKSLVFGVNDVCKLLENQQVGAILVANDVQPRFFVEHIIDQAVLYNVPILVVSQLRTILQNKCGRNGAVIALKKNLKPNSNLSLIQQAICNIYENYQPPKNHINYQRRLTPESATIDISDTSVLSISDSEDVPIAKDYHLKKDSNSRVFIPPNSELMEVERFSFISCGEVGNTAKNDNYIPLVVKRVKGDKNRNTRKLNKIKKR